MRAASGVDSPWFIVLTGYSGLVYQNSFIGKKVKVIAQTKDALEKLFWPVTIRRLASGFDPLRQRGHCPS